ncbi:long-chain fatty acid--CoA ligase [Novosphingobium sp. KA1]|jgi:long-chain acyl-CoA synthetase|uniref:long-chain-fatty-acid--CoA ligase n=1 Tax=Novosphingobium sp. (strain KA1) TaxID=164608 RepID=UPI001A8E6914|nr:long-chain fatty acid--CoA ligase [Novosphingobium sp. KA1]QSR19535.1 hypothetical protein CA833_20445 [Novosphingobium sp. KA1]
MESWAGILPAHANLKSDSGWLKMPPQIGTGNLAVYIRDCCTEFSGRVAFVEGDRELSYEALWLKAGALAGFLRQQCSVNRGDRVAVMLPNIMAFPIAVAGIVRAGAVQVNINPYYTAHELKHLLNDSEADVIITTSLSLPAIRGADVRSIRSVILVDNLHEEDLLSLPAIWQVADFEDALGSKFPAPDIVDHLGKEDLAFLQYTGGTTGLPKGAMLSHGNIMANVRQFQAIWGEEDNVRQINVLTAIPLYHIFALTVNMMCMLSLGAKNVLIPNPRDLREISALWQRHKINFVTGVNTLFKALAAEPSFAELDFDPKLLAMGGGAPVQEVVSSRWKALTGRHIREGYGLSETSPILTCTPFAEERFLGSIGEVVPGTELAIRDENGADVPRGEVGELCARGPQVMQGYWRQPAATLQVMTSDGYFRTGDLARQDENGRYYIVDRQKDMILVSGFNVYPNEVEVTVSQLADVVECACVGVPDQTTGEAVVLFVVGRTQNFDVQRIRVHCRENMAAYKVPRHIHMIEEMPKSSVGKILRRELRERLIHGKVMEES